MNYDEYHIQYDFMMLLRLSYLLHVFRRADPKRCLLGNTVPEPSGRPDGIVGFRTGVGNYEQGKCPDDRASEEWSTGGGRYINRYFCLAHAFSSCGVC